MCTERTRYTGTQELVVHGVYGRGQSCLSSTNALSRYTQDSTDIYSELVAYANTAHQQCAIRLKSTTCGETEPIWLMRMGQMAIPLKNS